ncbi:MAG: cytoplasmic chaperone TorD family protein [Actinobacteria bacterium]|nr:cytoplasmic chaperone TorD family protein [Actinomycetota bacterium]
MGRHTLLSDTLRGQTYKILAECFYSPDDELMALLRDVSESPSAFVCRLADVAGEVTEPDQLPVDHAKLFVGPYKLLAPPYGSVYLEDGRLMGQSTIQVKNLYSEEGLHFVLREAPDHVSVELEFMYLLISRTIEAANKSDCDEERCYRDKQRSFLAGHLGQWVPAFATKLEDAAQTNFYRTLGNVTRLFVEEDLTDLCRVDQESG